MAGARKRFGCCCEYAEGQRAVIDDRVAAVVGSAVVGGCRSNGPNRPDAAVRMWKVGRPEAVGRELWTATRAFDPIAAPEFDDHWVAKTTIKCRLAANLLVRNQRAPVRLRENQLLTRKTSWEQHRARAPSTSHGSFR